MEKLKQTLSQINWDFTDYNSIKYPIDINSIPWYPATFPAPIPRFLIALLTKEGEIVLDPFGGKGTTCVEALKQNRLFYYNDLNPFAVDIIKLIIDSLYCYSLDPSMLKKLETDKIKRENLNSKTYPQDIIISKETTEADLFKLYPQNMKERLEKNQVSREAIWWYHVDTLIELLNILEKAELKKEPHNDILKIKKLALITILKDVNSQRGHYTYVTDNCRPPKLHYYDAVFAYASMVERIKLSIEEFLKQDKLTNRMDQLEKRIENSHIYKGDARKLEWLRDSSIDLVITSPPYLCAQDYIKTMRLSNFFFPDDAFGWLYKNEIGARSKRKGKPSKVVNEFYDDMKQVFKEIYRVLKKDKFFCLIFGQGKGKVTRDYDTIAGLISKAEECGFQIFNRTRRNIIYKSMRIGGVDTEDIVIFQKQ